MARMEATGSLTPAPTVLTTAPSPLPGVYHTTPSFDPIELLPAGGPAEKLRMLRLRVDDSHRLIPEFETVREASMAKIEAANALQRLVSHPQHFGFGLKEDDRRVIEAKRLLDKLTVEARRVTELRDLRSAQWQAIGGVVRNIENWLRGGFPGGCMFEAVEDAPLSELLTKNDGGRIDTAVERLRLRLRECAADLHRVRSSPWPSSVAKAAAKELIERLADQGAPDLDAAIEHGMPISFVQTTLRSAVLRNLEAPTAAYTETVDVFGTMCWLFRDQMIAKICAGIDEIADDQNALDQRQREQMEAEIGASVLMIERNECSLIWAAEAKGEQINFRDTTSPQAVLGITLVVAPRADVPDTSAAHAFDIVGGARRR